MELYYVMSILDRNNATAMFDICKDLHLSVQVANIANGTATSEHLLLYDLEQSEKAIISTIATGTTMRKLVYAAERKLYMDIPGNGILIAIPLKSVSGGKNLAFITDGQEIGEGKPNMTFEHELIVVILNEGYADTVMEAARSAGAAGGTILHARGTNREKTQKFYGVSLAEEKEMIYIVASADNKSAIMQAINRDCGTDTPSGALCFSMPVSEVVGLRRLEELS